MMDISGLAKDMTLRDCLAGQALVGLLANQSYVKAVVEGEGENGTNKMAEIAYELADALLAERNKDKP